MHYKDYNIKDNIQSTLASSFSASSTLLTVKTGGGTNMPGAGTIYTIEKVDPLTRQVLQMEKVMCTSKAGDNFQMIRAYSNTTAYNWVKGDFISLYVVEEHERNNQYNKISTDLNNVFAENVYDTATNTYNHTGGDGIPNRASTDLVKGTIIYFAPISTNQSNTPKFAIWGSGGKNIYRNNLPIAIGDLIQNRVYCIVFDGNIRHIIGDSINSTDANTILQPPKNSNATSGKFVYYNGTEYRNVSGTSNKIPLGMVDKGGNVITSSGIVNIVGLTDIGSGLVIGDNLRYEQATGTITNIKSARGWYLGYIKSTTEFHLNIGVNSMIPVFSSNGLPTANDIFNVDITTFPIGADGGITGYKLIMKNTGDYLLRMTQRPTSDFSTLPGDAAVEVYKGGVLLTNMVSVAGYNDIVNSSGADRHYIYTKKFSVNAGDIIIITGPTSDMVENVVLARGYSFAGTNIDMFNNPTYITSFRQNGLSIFLTYNYVQAGNPFILPINYKSEYASDSIYPVGNLVTNGIQLQKNGNITIDVTGVFGGQPKTILKNGIIISSFTTAGIIINTTALVGDTISIRLEPVGGTGYLVPQYTNLGRIDITYL